MPEIQSFPHDQLVIGHDHVAEAALADLLHGRELPSDTPDLTAVAARPEQLRRFFRALSHHACGKDLANCSPEELDRIAGQAHWNTETTSYPKEEAIVTNDSLVSGNELERIIRRTIARLRKLRDILGYEPLVILDYFDDSSEQGCFTTRMLKDTLLNLFSGYPDAYKEFVYDGLRANFQTDQVPMTNDPRKYLQKLDEHLKKGAIVLSGGTFCSAEDIHGQWFQNRVMSKLLENPFIRGIMICWSYQVLSRALAQKHNMPLFVLKGALKFGAFPVTMLNSGSPLSQMFQRRGGHTSTATFGVTHTDHLVVIPTSGREKLKTRWNPGDHVVTPHKKTLFRVIAVDPLTGQPYGFTTDDGRFIAFAGHPEIRISPARRSQLPVSQDIETIRTFLRRVFPSEFFTERHHLDPGVPEGNFLPLDRHGKNIVRRDPGPPFYAAALDHLSRSLLRQLTA